MYTGNILLDLDYIMFNIRKIIYIIIYMCIEIYILYIYIYIYI